MTRTISQAMLVACAPAGQLLRDQVRNMRQLLRERRRLIFSTAKDKVGGAASKVSGAVKELADRASTLFRAPQS